MDSLLPKISDFFMQKKAWFPIFAQYDVRVEGWFKGEMLMCLQQLLVEKEIDEFEPEFTIGAKGWGKKGQLKIDFRIRKDRLDHLCELKAVCISEAKTGRGLDFYFRPKDNKGLTKDFQKLRTLQRREPLWILSFFYPAPSKEEWNRVVRKYERDINPWTCLTSLSSYPDWFFLGCWRLDRDEKQRS